MPEQDKARLDNGRANGQGPKSSPGLAPAGAPTGSPGGPSPGLPRSPHASVAASTTPGGTTLSAHAYAFATTFRLRELSTLFQADKSLIGQPSETLLEKDCLAVVFDRSVVSRLQIAVLFDFGAVVMIGIDGPRRDALIKAIIDRVGPEPHAPLTEEFLIEVAPGAPIEVKFDRVVLHDPTLPTLKLVSLLFSQSVAMDYYDEDVQEIQRRSDDITASMRSEGRLPGRVGDLVRFIGTCMETKNDVIATMALFDKPDATWEDPDLDRLYNALRAELEIDDRFRALESKLRMIQENLVLLVDLTQHRSTWRLEMTVVVLILFEVLISLWQLANGRAHL